MLRSETRARLLAALLLQPAREASIAELVRQIGADPGTCTPTSSDCRAGILADRRVGPARLIRATDGPLVRPLTDLLMATYGPKPLLEEALADEPGVDQALIVGSWATRYRGEPGHPRPTSTS